MSSFDYTAKRAMAKRLIEKFGAAGSFILPGNDGGTDPNTGDTIPAQPDTTILGTVTPILRYKGNEIDGKTIQTGDGYVFFHSDVAPTIGYLHTQNGDTWRAVNIMEMTSVGGVNVYRKIQLRRGG